MQTTKLSLEDKLPLTCSRTGTCCHGKAVWLNPWELMCLAKEKKLSTRAFRDQYSDFGGIRLRFDGKPGWKQQVACSQYVDGFGCGVHLGRPLACRLYPLGRQIQSETVHYMYEGKEFPCLEGCPVVTELPKLSVGEYLKGQASGEFEKAQDAYLDLMQNLADIAFELLLDTSLAASGDTLTLAAWKEMGKLDPEELKNRIGEEWMDALILPEITEHIEDPVLFAQQHNELIQLKIQASFGTLETNADLHQASVLVMALALHLARSIGADPQGLAEYWVGIAKENGAV